MSLLTGDRLQRTVDRYYKKCRKATAEARHTGHSSLVAKANAYECIADTLKASADIPELRDKVSFYRCLVSTVGNRVRMVRQEEGDKGLAAAYKMAMELLELVEDIMDRDGLREDVSLGEAKIEEDVVNG